MISDHPVDLFRHCPVKAPQPGFHMGDWNMEFCCSQCASKRRVRIPIDKYPVWALFQEHLLNCFENTTCLVCMSARANPQVIVWGGNVKLIEELLRQTVIVVLPG